MPSGTAAILSRGLSRSDGDVSKLPVLGEQLIEGVGVSAYFRRKRMSYRYVNKLWSKDRIVKWAGDDLRVLIGLCIKYVEGDTELTLL